MTGDTSLGMSVVVRVEPVHDAYEVVLEDGDELVLAHYDTLDGDHAREDAERWAADVRRLLRATGRRRR